MKNKVTAHMIVKNEDIWVWFAVQAILDSMEKIIIYDTGSTDKTLEIVDTFKSDKIQLIKMSPLKDGEDFYEKFTKCKNEMIEMTTTPWWLCVDGDEIYSNSINEMVNKLHEIPEEYTVLSVRMKYFVEHLHRVSAEDVTYRYAFVRTGAHRWGYGYGDEILCFPQPVKDQRLSYWYSRESWEFDCFHTSFLQRSSLDTSENSEAYQRKHRQLRSQVGKLYNGMYGYCGPYPEVFYRKDIPEIVKNQYIEQIYKTKEEFGM